MVGREQLPVGTFPVEERARKMLEHVPVTATSTNFIRRAISFPYPVEGITTLDIGGGGSDITATLLEEGANAFAVDPRYKSRSDVKGRVISSIKISQYKSNEQRLEMDTLDRWTQSIKKYPERYIAAFANKLPFRDNEVDLVFSVASVLGWLDMDFDVLQSATDEAIRVTRPGGSIQLYPLADRTSIIEGFTTLPHQINVTNRLLQWLESKNMIEHRIEGLKNTSGRRLVISKL